MKRLSTLLPSLLFTTFLYAQYYEAGVTTGASNYIGELSEQRLIADETGLVQGIFGRYNFSKRFSAKASVMKGLISGSDENARFAENRERNLNFRSDVVEFAITGEWNLSDYNIRDNKTGVPYLFAGVGVSHFNPQAQMRGAWYDLQPLRTEGKKYSRTTLAIPFGIGIRFNLTYKINFGLEAGARMTFTDYLDDVSSNYPDILSLRSYAPESAALSYRTPELTGEFGENPLGNSRGNDSNKDWYFFMGLNFSVNLTDKYGLDFDPKYEIFKEHLKKEKEAKKELTRKRHKKAKYQKKLRMKAKRAKLQPVVKKRMK